jgi:hypothetical protein
MASKGDIQATRFTATTTNAIVAPRIRLRGIIVSNDDATNSGVVTLTNGSQAGAALFTADIPAGDVINFSFPEDGILFKDGIYVSTFSTVNAVTLLTDKYSGV